MTARHELERRHETATFPREVGNAGICLANVSYVDIEASKHKI